MADRQGDDKGRQRRPSPPDNGLSAVSIQNRTWVNASTACAAGRRSASSLSNSASEAVPRQASASFQPRLLASWMPLFMPWAPAGAVGVGGVAGVEHATGPEGRRQPVLQDDPRGPGHVAGSDPPTGEDRNGSLDVGGGRRRGAAGPVGLEDQQPPRRMLAGGEQDEAPSGPMNTCAAPLGRSASRSRSASNTDLRSSPPLNATPAWRLTVLLAPSQPAR
jgi:hypothetical protein